MPEESDNIEMSRRAVLVGTASVAGIASMSSVTAAEVVEVAGDVKGDFAILKGPKSSRPSPKGDNRYLYIADDEGDTLYLTTWEDNSWTNLGTLAWVDTDGDNRLELPDHDGIDVGIVEATKEQRLPRLTSDPSGVPNGTVWYRSDLD